MTDVTIRSHCPSPTQQDDAKWSRFLANLTDQDRKRREWERWLSRLGCNVVGYRESELEGGRKG